MRALVSWVLSAGLASGVVFGGSGPEKQTRVPLRKLESVAPSSGFQVVRSDAKGRARLITEELVVYSVTASGALRQEVALETDAQPTRPFQPALSADGASWLVAVRDGGLVLFDGARGVPLPPPPMPPQLLAFLGTEPAFGSALDPRRRALLERTFGSATPYLLRLSGSDWDAVLTSDETARDDRADLLATSYLAAPDTKSGRLWLAKQFELEVKKLSPAGKELLAVSRPDLRVADEVDAEKEAALLEGMERKGVRADRVISVLVVPETVVRAIAVWSGDAYLLVAEPSSGELSIYRVESATGDLDRAPIQVERPELIRSMAATESGLILAAARAPSGLWSVDWSALGPHWTAVPEAVAPKPESPVSN